MRHLTIIRHAKSARDDPSLSDFERPLKRRGQRDAPAVGKELARRGLAPDRVLCSPARRTVDTLDLIREHLEIPAADVHEEPELYGASTSDLLRILAALPADLRDVVLVGHNPGLEDLCHRLGTTAPLKTACVARFRSEADTWGQLATAPVEPEWFLSP